jgi:hypothetical protein
VVKRPFNESRPVASDNQHIFKDRAVHPPQVNEDKNPPSAKSGLYRFLGALLMRVRTERYFTGEVGAIKHNQLSFEHSINCPVVSWANQSIGTLMH